MQARKGGKYMTRKRPRVKVRYGRIAILAILLTSFIMVGAAIGFVAGAIRNMPQYDLDNITGDLSSFVLDMDDNRVASLKAAKNRVELTQNQIPTVMKKALIAIEDQRFYKHHGIDLYRLGGAVVANITKGYGSQGASTITQQLAGNAVLKNREKKMRRKIQEAIIALQLENKKSKEEILTLYLNNVYYGHGAWSLQTASQIYFGKDAKDLELGEAAMLAGLINAPNRYSPYINMEKAKQRQALVLNEMVEIGAITKEDAEKTKNAPLNLAGLKSNTYQYQSFIDYVVEEAADILDLEENEISALYTNGFKFYTTMDAEAQKTAEEIYADDSYFPPNKNGKMVQSAMIVIDHRSGGVRCLIGGRNQEGERQFNRAVQSTRQPGSVFKPIAVYGPALELGYSPATVLDDFPMEYPTPQGSKTFVNYDNRYRGLISMRTALQYSVNTVAVKMLDKIGINEGFNFAQRLGITSLVESGPANDMGLSLALGGLTHGVSPLELTASYGAFANQGIYVKPYVIRKIEDNEGNVLYEHIPQKKVVMSTQTAYLMSDMLQTVVTAGTAPKARMSNMPVAGKTGTTSFNVDAWFSGYTPHLSGSVWLGFDKKEKMSNVFGGSYGAPIWKKVMEVAHRNLPSEQFVKPEGIVSLPVDYKSGLIPTDLTPAEYVKNEFFNQEYAPTEKSNVWIELPICADSGKLLTDFCPNPVTKVFLKRPVPWTGSRAPEDAKLEPPKEYCPLHGGSSFPGGNTGITLHGSPQLDSRNQLKSVKLTWHYPTTNSTVYQIYRSTKPNVSLDQDSRVAELQGSSNTWQDERVDSDNTYYYVIIAKDVETNEITAVSRSIMIQPTKGNDQKLKAPHLKGEANVNATGASINLTWTKAAENHKIVYYIFRSTESNFTPDATNQVAKNVNLTGTSWTDSNVERNKTYYYKVIAFDTETNQQSSVSNQLKVVLP